MTTTTANVQSAQPEQGTDGSATKPAGTKNSYGQILKSSALIGGSSVVEILVGMVRVKAMAILLGPAGFGLMGLFTSIADLTRSIAGMGVNTSGVRQIAEAVGSGDNSRIALTTAVLRRTAVVLGALGALFLIVFCRQVSTLTFGSAEYATPVALLSAVVFVRTVSDGQGALIQGLRRIADLAKSHIIGSVTGTVIGILLLYFFREDGVVPSLIAIACASLALTWWYVRKVEIQTPSLTVAQLSREVRPLLRLGLAFMASGLLMLGVGYVIRIFVLRHSGLDAAGYYSSAWALGGLYIGIILQAMGADFYPRLTGIASDNAECNRTVNEQAQISLLLAGPGVLATLTLAPLVISIFYSSDFHTAVPLLRWICLGMMLRVVSWPMGFILLAKGLQKPFLISDALWALVHVGLAWALLDTYGLNGAGMAFFGSYVFHIVLIYAIVRKVSGFQWSIINLKLGLLFLSLVGLVFCGFLFLTPWLATVTGGVVAVASGIYSLRSLAHLVSLDRLPKPVRVLLEQLRLVPKVRP